MTVVGPVLVVGGDGKIGRALAGHLEALGVEVLTEEGFMKLLEERAAV